MEPKLILVMVLFGSGCKLNWREPVDVRTRPCRVVAVTPFSNDLSGVAVAGKQVLVQAFISQTSVDLSTKPFCIGLSGWM